MTEPTPGKRTVTVPLRTDQTVYVDDVQLKPYDYSDPQYCRVDGREIKMLAFRNLGVCCEYCRKVNDGEIEDGRRAVLPA